MPRSVLALDVSVRATGWAFGLPGDKPVGGVIRFAPIGATEDEVWYAALKWMTQQMGALNPDAVAIEAAIMTSSFDDDGKPQTNPKTQGMLWGLQAVLRTVVKATRPGAARLVHASSARKLLTGKGNYPKGEAKPAVKQRCIDLGWVEDDATYDRCDALCVWAKACAEIDPAFAAQFTPLGQSKPRPKPLLIVEAF